jgi:hypothetical protein
VRYDGARLSAVDMGDIGLDGERLVDFSESEPILPDTTRDDTDAGWGERPRDSTDWLRDERPPHWD